MPRDTRLAVGLSGRRLSSGDFFSSEGLTIWGIYSRIELLRWGNGLTPSYGFSDLASAMLPLF